MNDLRMAIFSEEFRDYSKKNHKYVHVLLEKHQKSFFATYEHLREISIEQIDGHTRR